MKPPELREAELVDTLCRRYGCLPSQLLEEDAGYLLMMGQLLDLGADVGE